MTSRHTYAILTYMMRAVSVKLNPIRKQVGGASKLLELLDYMVEQGFLHSYYVDEDRQKLRVKFSSRRRLDVLQVFTELTEDR